MANSSTFTFNIKAIADMKDVINNIQQIQGALGKLKMPEGLKTSFNKTFSELEKETTKYQELLTKGFKTKGDVSTFAKSGNNILRLYDELASKIKSIDNSALKNMFKDLGAEQVQQLKQDFNDLQESLKSKINGKDFASGFKSGLQELRNKLKETNKDASELAAKLQKSTFNTFAKNLSEGRLDLAANNLKSIQEQIQALGDAKPPKLQEWVDNLSTAFENLKNDSNIQNIVTQLEEVKSKLTGAEAQVIQELINKFQGFQGAVSNSNGELQTFIRNGQQAASSTANLNREVDQVKSRIQYFFGLANSINLVKRAIRSAFETVKELDAAMTETAVVTNHTISDMWQKLPEYTKRANQLGVSTLAAYQSATLYYQQGLNDQQAGELSTETLKMARIAGLEAAEATDRMTNALRGFNMELNTIDAQRVDDVYSQLAAMSASNVDEISTAMTKVASLAHSANMEFETTAAFLAQIIETTRESAETAGTALKTVVARFSEVKKLVDTDQLKGTDEEGQIIDVNKVSQALRTAGIDLNKYFLGEVGLDDIFMELASKWDSLTSIQQRYIATQAAGSRQQSRFIALMQDYARTQQLVGAAYNAEGASARQFEKTQDSLQSKLARLKNAWNEFLMGITNSGVIKGVVDVLTTLLNIINKLTGAFGPAASGFLKFGVAAATIWGGKKAFSDTGIATKAIGALVGNTPLGKLMGLSGGAAEGAATPTPLIFGSGSLLSKAGKGLWNSMKGLGSFMGFGTGGNSLAGVVGAADPTGSAGLAAGLGGIATAFGAIAVAAGAAYGAYQLWLNASPEGQLKTAQKYADAMSEAAINAQKQASELKKASEQVKDYDSAVSQASTATNRRSAIEDRNNYIESLLEQDSRYAEYLTTTFENGQMVLKLNIDAEDINKALKGVDMASAGADFASAMVADKQIAVLRRKLDQVDLANNKISYYNEGGAIEWRAMTANEIAKYTKYQSDLERYATQSNTYAQKAFSELISTDRVSDDVANLMSKALAEGFDDTQLPTGSGWWATRGHWQNKYLEAYGTEADTSMATADIYRAVRMHEITTGQANKTEDLTNLLTGASKEAYQSLLEGFTGEGKISSKNLLGLNTDNEGSIYDFLGLNINDLDSLGEQLSKLADALGMTTDEVREGIKKRAQAEKKAQQSAAFTTSANMFQAGIGGENIAKYLTLANIEDQQFFNNLFSTFDASFLSDELVSNILDGIRSGDEELSNWLKSIDLSNPIQSVNKLTDAAKNGNGMIKETAQSLLDAGNSSKQFSSSIQLGYFATSQSFEDISEQLDKFIDENGKISAANIKELAAANSDLNDLLENNITSATGLAIILTKLQNGTINVWDLNDAIIAATAAMDDLDGTVAQTIDDLNGFDPGYDENDVTKFINQVLDNATENIDKGATGNNQMRNYMEYIFGNFDKEFEKGLLGTDYNTAYETWLNNNVAWLEANKDNMFSAWSDFTETLTNQELKLFDDQGNVIHEAAKIWQDGEEVFIEANGMTTDQLIQAMVQTGEMTEQQARMMIADFKNYSSDFAHEMAENDLPNVIQAWSDALPTINGAKIYDEADITTLAHLLNLGVDQVREAVENLEGYAENYKSITWTNENGERTAESIKAALDQINPDILKKGLTTVTDGLSPKTLFGDAFDYDKVKAAYNDLGIPQLFESDFNQIAKSGDAFFTSFFGNPTEISIKEGKTAGEAYAEAYQEAVNTDLADKLSTAINTGLQELFGGDSGFEININAEEGLLALNQVKDATEDVSKSITKVNELTVAPKGDSSNLNEVSSALDNIIAKIHTIQSSSVSPGGYGAEAAPGLYGITATGGIVKSYSTGSENFHVTPGTALTGEEDPEIVWNKQKGYAYITGANGPEFQNLQPGDRVFNASETKKILKNSSLAKGGKVHSFARGYGDATKSGVGGGGRGGGDDKTPEEWRNDLDWLYNLMEDIAELERDQKEIEERYEDYLIEEGKTGKDLYKLLIQQLGNLYTQLEHQQFALEKREQEMREFMDTTNDQDQYLWYNWEDRTIEIDWDAIDQIVDQDLYKHVKELIDEAEEIQGKIDNADDSIMDITNQIQELENIWRDTFVDFEDRVLKAIIKQYQTVIDNFSELNDTLNDSNAQILDSLQKQISLERQIRDNTKTEEEIANDEARLAYLRRDTSGGNELAALQLEKEVDDNRQNYEDSLVDQAISRLQEDNDAAAQQRERQIEIMQAQLDYQSENGEFNAYIRELLDAAIGEDGELLTDSELYNLLRTQDNWEAMSAVNQRVWEEELNNTFKEVVAFLLKENAQESGVFTQALTSAIEAVNASIGSYSQGITKFLNEGSGSSGSGGGSGGSSGGSSTPKGNPPPPTSQPTYQVINSTGQVLFQSTSEAAANAQANWYGGGGVKVKKKYATGGLNTQTGPAWLDGTPSEPEYVLNARQTDAFLKLADVLPSMMNGSSTTTSNTFGSTYVNFSVNLESVSPDYDVDRMVDLVKDKLYDSGSYRNNNVLSFLR